MKRKINIKSITIMIIVVGFFYVVKSQFPVYSVSSQNMFPALTDGDIILVNKNFDINKENTIAVFKVNDRTHINRIVGLPGDKIEIKDGVLYINDVKDSTIKTSYQYRVKLENHPVLAENDLLMLLKPINNFEEYEAILTTEQVAELSILDVVKSIQKIIHPKSYNYTFSKNPIYPNNASCNWSRDNFGPITIPKKGAVIGKNKTVITNSFYFLLADKRHQALDSRYWGLIAEINIEGTLITKIYSK